MNDENVRSCCRLFNEARTNVHDEERSGRPTVMNEELTQNVDEELSRKRRFTIDELQQNFPQV